MEQQNNSSLGKIMLIFAIALGGLTWFFAGVLDKQRNPNQQPQSVSNNQGLPEVILQQNHQGHYVATGAINGYKVDFLLDTGATGVAIPENIAKKMSLKPGAEIQVSTANGVVSAQLTRLDSVQLGTIVLHDIKATINPTMDEDDEILLGMSFLRKLEMVQRNKTLILRQY